MKFTLVVSLMVLLLTSNLSFAFDPYLGVTIGTELTSVNKLSDASGSLNTDFNPGYVAGLTTGIAFDSSLGWNLKTIRAEAEIAYRSSDLTKMRNSTGLSASMNGSVSVTSFMLNCYLENTSLLAEKVPLNLFFTIGAGGAVASISSISYMGTVLVNSANDTQFAYQGGFGVGYNLTKNVTLDTTYKYMGTTDFKLAGVNAEYGSHNVLLGLRYTFK